MTDLLKIVLWNANGLSRRKAELEHFLNDESIDIALIAETHFTNRFCLKRLENYKIFSCNHPSGRARGGAAIIIKNSIQCYEHAQYQTEEIQAPVVTVQLHGVATNIAAVYCPPNRHIESNSFLDFFRVLGSRWIIGGDYNAKHAQWGSRTISPRGRELLKACQSSNCSFLSSGEPTHWPADSNKSPDLLDFFLTREVSNNYAIAENVSDLSSDHVPVLLTISSTILRKSNSTHLTNKNTNWDAYRETVSRTINLKV